MHRKDEKYNNNNNDNNKNDISFLVFNTGESAPLAGLNSPLILKGEGTLL